MRTVTTLLLPVVAKGPIVRRPRAARLAESVDSGSRAVAWMQQLRNRYGPGPLRIDLPFRHLALVLEPGDVHRVLNETPTPFSPASWEKRGALGHFQPDGVLISTPQQRQYRRPFNETVLQTGHTVHDHGEAMVRVVQEEVDALLGQVDFTGRLEWEPFARAWWRIVRRVVLGDTAREDEGITDDLLRLRRRANFSYLAPRDQGLRDRFTAGVRYYLARGEGGSLAGVAAGTPHPDGTEPHQQLPQWLFAFDAAAWAAFRALALLATHPSAADRAGAESTTGPDLPYLRASVLESLRLWPTTPLILRDTTAETTWQSGTLPAGTAVVLFSPFFHRDDQRLVQADRFDPELWLRERGDSDWPLMPFSGGAAMCPGRNVTLLVASAVLGRLLARRTFHLEGALDTERLPGTLSPFHLQFTAGAS